MRKLSKKQKNIIIDYIKNNYFDDDLLIDKFGNRIILLKQLEKVNDYELLYNDFDRLKNDLLFIDKIEDKINYTINFN